MAYNFNKIKQICDEGLTDSYVDAYYMLVDMGEVKESEYMKRKCENADRDMLIKMARKILEDKSLHGEM